MCYCPKLDKTKPVPSSCLAIPMLHKSHLFNGARNLMSHLKLNNGWDINKNTIITIMNARTPFFTFDPHKKDCNDTPHFLPRISSNTYRSQQLNIVSLSIS